MTDHDWIVSIAEPARPSIRLYCFPYAGGSAASYASWCSQWQGGAALRLVELPGRSGAPSASAFRCVSEVVEPLLRQFLGLQRHDPTPFAFYGHSLGALLAFELTRALRRTGARAPMFLAVSGRRAPHCPLRGRALWDLQEPAFSQMLERMGGIPGKLVRSEKWRAFVSPTLRADLRLSDEYLYVDEPPLDLPLLTFRGASDPILLSEELAAWRLASTGRFEMGTMPGAHFFSPEGRVMLRRRLQAALTAAARGRCPIHGGTVPWAA